MAGGPFPANKRASIEGAQFEMDLGGFNWTLLTIAGPALLAVVILWALLRNRATRGERERTEQATRDLYREEEAERRHSSEKGP
jgi:cyanate permease